MKSFTNYHVYSSDFAVMRNEIATRNPDSDFINIAHELFINSSRFDFISEFKTVIREHIWDNLKEPVRLNGGCDNEYYLEWKTGCIYIIDVEKKNVFVKRPGVFWMGIYAESSIAENLFDAIAKKFDVSSKRPPRIDWWYVEDGRANHRTMPIMAPTKPVLDEFYPWIAEGVDKFFDRYRESESSILFMMGAPGTGKTSLIKHYIYKYSEGAMITYDDTIFNTDGMFLDYLTEDRNNLLVIEDADMMLGSREHAGNKLMAKFLNISEGLIKFKEKKIIFTTNMENFNNVDQALVREGRCFGSIKFRHLTADEAQNAACAAGLPVPVEVVDGGEITLAKLFNPSKEHKLERRKVGF